MEHSLTGNAAAIESALGIAPPHIIQRVLRRVQPWVEAETPSGHEQPLVDLSLRIEDELRALGAGIEAFAVPGLGRNLRATVAGEEPELAPLVILGHLDTVHPIGTLLRQPFRIDGDRAEGPGIFDMKTGVALAVEALAWFHEREQRPRRPVRLILTCDEEIGSHGARALFRQSCEDAAAALVPEPCLADGSVKTRRKGVGTYRVDVHGRAAHAGVEPHKAVSAIAELAGQIMRILDLADHDAGTTINVGLIGGGTASNVVPAHAWATVDTRFVEPAEGDRLDAALLGLGPRLAGSRLEVVRNEMRPPLVRTAGVVALYEEAGEVAAGLGVELGEGSTGGGSDGSLVASWGTPTLDGLGARGGGAHAIDEHIVLSDLPFRLALLVGLLRRL